MQAVFRSKSTSAARPRIHLTRMENAQACLAAPGHHAQEGNCLAAPARPATLPSSSDAGTSEMSPSDPQQGKQRCFSPLSVADHDELKKRCGKRPSAVEGGKGVALVVNRQKCPALGNAEVQTVCVLVLCPRVSDRR